MQKEDVLLKRLPVCYHETHQTLNRMVSDVIYLQCGTTKAYEHALSLSLKRDLSTYKEISGCLLNYIKQEEPLHAWRKGRGVS